MIGRPERISKQTSAQYDALALRDLDFETLTPSQLKVLRLIMAGFTSFRDIGAAAGIASANGVFCIVRDLRKLGLVTSAPAGGRQARTLRPLYRFIKAEDL